MTPPANWRTIWVPSLTCSKRKPGVSVRFLGLVIAMEGHTKSFHAPVKANNATTVRTGRRLGNMIYIYTCQAPAPLMAAPSSSSWGIEAKAL